MSFIIPHDAAFTSWLASNKEGLMQDWETYVCSCDIHGELQEQTGISSQEEALALLTDTATEAFRDFARTEFDDSRDFSNSGL